MDRPNERMVEVACGRLGLTPEQAEACYKEADGMPDAGFFSPGSSRGGGRLLVSSEGEALWAASAISPAKHIEAFRLGRRS